jgi:hypothetical protein
MHERWCDEQLSGLSTLYYLVLRKGECLSRIEAWAFLNAEFKHIEPPCGNADHATELNFLNQTHFVRIL